MMLSAGYRIHFETGRSGDPQFGGTITCPNGMTVTLVFENGTWRLPTMTAQKAAAIKHCNHVHTLTAENSGISPDNPYQILLNKARQVEPLRESQVPEDIAKVEELDQQTMQLIQDRWCHPSNSKMEMIV